MAPDAQSRDHLSHEVLLTPEAIAAEQPAWDAIVDEDYDGHPFLSMSWFELWLKHFAQPPVQLCFTKVMYRGKPIAYFPLIIKSEQFHTLPVRVLRFAGNIYSPINTPLISRGSRPDVFEYFVREVLPGLRWTVFLSSDLPLEYVGSAETHCALVEAGYRSYLLPSEGNWVFDQPGSNSKDYLRSRDSTTRNHIRRLGKKIGRVGSIRFEVISESLNDQHIEYYLDVYGRSGKEPEVDVTFHPALIKMASNQGLLHLFLLFLDDQPIATQLWLVRGNRGYPVKFAYDEAFRVLSPGNVIMWQVMQFILDDLGVCYVDFAKGDDYYKKYWTSRRRQRLGLLTFAKSWRATQLHLLDRSILPAVRRLRWLNAIKRAVAGRIHQTDASR